MRFAPRLSAQSSVRETELLPLWSWSPSSFRTKWKVELRRRRPAIAERLDTFAARKRAYNKLADALVDIIDERVNPMHGATNW